MKFNDISGQNFGDWIALEQAKKRDHNQSYWVCRCVCGTVKEVSYSSLIAGSSKGCGCKRGERFSQSTRKDDRVRHIITREYKACLRRHRKYSSERPISFDEYSSIIGEPCFYCGKCKSRKIADYSCEQKRVTDTIVESNGIDRMDSSSGYITGNVVSCCTTCNRAKNDMDVKDFKTWVRQVYENFVLK